MVTTTTNLGLRVDTDLTANAKANLYKLDQLGAIYRINQDGAVYLRSGADVTIQPGDESIASGEGNKHNLNLGSTGNHIVALNIYADAITLSSPLEYQYLDLTDSILNSDINSAAGIVYSKLDLTNSIVNADVAAAAAIEYSKLNLANSITNADINASAAIEYSKLDLALSIMNSDISAAAAIARSKLASGTAGYVLINDGSGNVSEEQFLATSRGGFGFDASSLTIPTSGTLLTDSNTATLSNKSISGSSNTFSNIPYSALSLTDSIVLLDLNSSISIPYSYLNLNSSITNSDVSGTAAIAGSKINPDFGSQNISTSGELRLESGALYSGFEANSGMASSLMWTLPATDGTAGQALVTDGSQVLAWSSVMTSFLSENAIWIGNSSDERQSTDLTSIGDISANVTTGLTIKDATITNDKVSPTADIAYSKLNLTGSVTNADIAAAAAIGYSKLAALTTDRALQSSAAGVIEPSAVTSTELGYVSGVTSAIQTQLNNKAGLATYTLEVGAGKEYADLDSAITAANALSPTLNQQVNIFLQPGTYTAPTVTPLDYINLVGDKTESCRISGACDFTGITLSVQNLTFINTATADNAYALILGNGSIVNVQALLSITADYSGTALTLNPDAGVTTGGGNFLGAVVDTGSTSKTLTAVKFSGAGNIAAFGPAATIVSSATTNGTHRAIESACTGNVDVTSARMDMDHSGGTFTGVACFREVTTAPNRYTGANSFANGNGGGTGTLIAFGSSATGTAEIDENGGNYVIASGYGNEYTFQTTGNTIQVLRLMSPNTSIAGSPSSVAGQTLLTPYDDRKSGFQEWGGSGSYYTLSTAVNANDTFTLDRPGIGYIRTTPVYWEASQSVTLTANALNFIYVDSDGTLQATTSVGSIYEEGIVLFEVLYTKDFDTLVVKENHSYSFDTDVSRYAHTVLGTLLSGTGANLVAGTTSERLSISGDDTLTDHGLDTEISSETDITIGLWYKDASGDWVKYARVDGAGDLELDNVYNNAGTPTISTAGNAHFVWTIYVTKDDLEGTAQYLAVMNSTLYTSSSAALTAIQAGNADKADGILAEAEVAQLGYVVVKYENVGLPHDVNAIVIEKQVVGAALLGNTVVNTASNVTTDTTNFDGNLSGTDTSVQSALDTLDDLLHGDFSDLQGGTTGEYYHLSEANHLKLTTNALTASRPLATDASGYLVSTTFATWIAGTTDQITVTDDGDGSVTLSLPQSIATDSNVSFGSVDAELVEYSSTFNATTDWTNGTDEYTITITAATHGKGTRPTTTVTQTSDGAVIDCISIINGSGDVTISVAEDPDLRFAGTISII